jgi:hypothetical protein
VRTRQGRRLLCLEVRERKRDEDDVKGC